MHSALKRNGKPLYEYARAGIEIERQPRLVTIHRIETLSFSGDVGIVDVDCSKGTYIRTLAADIGERLGCGAHLSALRRIRIGDLDVSGAFGLTELESMAPEERDRRLSPVDALLAGIRELRLDEEETRCIRHGQGIRRTGTPGERFRLFSANGRFLGLGELRADGWLRPKRMMAEIPGANARTD